MTRRRLLNAALLLAFLLVAADTVAWLQLQRLLGRRLDAVTQQAAAAGWRLQASPGRRGGWPLAATREFAGPKLSHGGIVWSGESITAMLSLLHPRRLTILAGGPQVISSDGAGIGSSLRFWGSGMALHLPLEGGWFDHGRVDRIDLEAGDLHMALPGAGPDGVMTARRLRGLLRWNPQAHALTLTLHDLTLPQAGAAAMIGRDIPDAGLEMSLVGATGSDGDDFASRLRAWRAGGGRLLLRQAVLGWSGARIDASGEMSLDADYQPDGGFAVRLTGVEILLDRLARSGRVTPSMVSAMRAVLGLIAAGQARPDDSVSQHPLELWLTLRAGLLSLGQIPLLRIPSLVPPAPTAALP